MAFVIRTVSALTVLLAATLVGCGGNDNDEAWFGLLSMHDREANEPFPMPDEFHVCLDQPGVVEILEVSLEHSLDGLRVDDYAVKPHESPPPELSPSDEGVEL
jgi:hypothetical protein